VTVLLGTYLLLPRWFRALPPLLIAAALWWLSSRSPAPGEHPAVIMQYLHNCAHIVAYGSLGLVTLLALAHVGDCGGRHVVLATLLAAVYGVVDELHQSFVPGRDASVADATTDLVSALMLAVTAHWLLADSARSRRAVPWLALASLASAAAATWLPI
jgi:VanZ family protein